MKKQLRVVVAVLVAVLLAGMPALFGCVPEEETAETQTEEPEVTEKDEVALQVYADSSLSMALDEIQDLYREDHAWVTFYGTQYRESEEMVARLQIGSPDVLITASRDAMDTAEERGLVALNTREDIFSNDLVIVAKEGSELSDITLEDIAADTYTVAVGDDSVSVGTYTAQALSTVGAYTDPTGETGPKAQGKEGEYAGIDPLKGASVAEICSFVGNGTVDVAIVRSSDASRFSGIDIVGVIPPDTHRPIIYPGAIGIESHYPEDVAEFLAWATTDAKALGIWEKWGFELLA